MKLKVRSIVLAGVAAAATAAFGFSAIASAGSAKTPVRVAHAASSCNVGSGEGDGYTYLTSLTVTRTKCGTGMRVVHHKGHLRGWHCRRTVLDRSSVQYDAIEHCSSGRRRVVYTFTQNT